MSESQPSPVPSAVVPPAPPPGFLSLWGAILLIVLVVALQIACGLALIVLLALTGTTKPSDSQMAMSLVVINIITFAPVIGFGLWRLKLPRRDVIPLKAFHPLVLLPLVSAACGLGVLLSEADNLVQSLGTPEVFADLFRQLAQGGFWAVTAFVVVAPLTEELLFRGVMLTGLLRRYTVVRAVLYSAILFAISHLNPFQLASGLATGLFLGWLRIRTRSLWPCMAMHALFNAQVFLIPMLRDRCQVHIRGFCEVTAPGIVHFQPAWFDVLGAALLLLGIWGVTRLTTGATGCVEQVGEAPRG
jgi:membrane protease YdiL (CAAX protease family)